MYHTSLPATLSSYLVERGRHSMMLILIKSKVNTMIKSLSFLSILLVLLAATSVASFEFQLPKWNPVGPTSLLTTPKPSSKALLSELNNLISEAPVNGIDTPPELESEIIQVCQQLEAINPTRKPTKSDTINGFWKMLWTNFDPPAPSSGKLGPLTGTVYQDLDLSAPSARNILKISFPPIAGELYADPKIINDTTASITFVSVGNKIGGVIPLGPKIQFEEGKEVRLWEHIYLDDEYRILYARRADETDSRGFLYVMKRAEEERFSTNV